MVVDILQALACSPRPLRCALKPEADPSRHFRQTPGQMWSLPRLQCSSFLVMTYFLLKDYTILPIKELPSSPWVCIRGIFEPYGKSASASLQYAHASTVRQKKELTEDGPIIRELI